MCGIRVVYTDGIRRYAAGIPAWYTDGIRTVYGGIRLASCNLLIFVVKKVRVLQGWGTCITSTFGVT